MTWWRRLLRFLARDLIFEVILAERRECAAAVLLNRHADYLHGVRDGAAQAFDAVEASVRERMSGAQDLVTEEDLRRARKGLLH